MCVSCDISMVPRVQIPEAEVLSARFPKEYDHKKTCSEASQVVYIFHSIPCLFVIVQSICPYIHPYMHPHIHACMHAYT